MPPNPLKHSTERMVLANADVGASLAAKPANRGGGGGQSVSFGATTFAPFVTNRATTDETLLVGSFSQFPAPFSSDAGPTHP